MSETESADTLEVYSDFVCPFCYLGRASLREYLSGREDPPDVEWKFFDLRGYKRGPDGEIQEDVDDGKDDEYFEQARENVNRLRERYGVEMSMDFAGDVDSWDAQQAALYVKEEYDEDTFESFYHAVFDALWQKNRDIDDPEVLADIAAGMGINPDEIRDAVADEALEAELRERFAAAQDLGITGIPTFVYGDHAARGAVPPEQLERLVGR